jgi:dipeptide/tripeptide permease
MSGRQWQIVFGTVNAVCAFLLIQSDVPLNPVLKVALGAVVAGIGFVRAPDGNDA